MRWLVFAFLCTVGGDFDTSDLGDTEALIPGDTGVLIPWDTTEALIPGDTTEAFIPGDTMESLHSSGVEFQTPNTTTSAEVSGAELEVLPKSTPSPDISFKLSGTPSKNKRSGHQILLMILCVYSYRHAPSMGN